MIEEVNKIIYNMLISGRGVLLPQIGTLFIERQGARKISKDRLLSPRNVVVFSSHEQAPSLIDEIVAIAGCGTDLADDIYERWRAKTLQQGVLTIAGIGQLKGKSFVMEQEFNRAINPKGVKTLVVRRRSRGKWLYAVAAVSVVVALGFMAYVMWGADLLKKDIQPAAQPDKVAVVEQTLPVEESQPQNQDSLQTIQQPVQQSTEAAQPSQPTQYGAKEPALSQGEQSDRYSYYVVMGVFSTEANADRAIEQVHSKASEAKCEVLPFGSKFMVTMYGSESREDCNTFARSYRELFPDLWIYNKK